MLFYLGVVFFVRIKMAASGRVTVASLMRMFFETNKMRGYTGDQAELVRVIGEGYCADCDRGTAVSDDAKRTFMDKIFPFIGYCTRLVVFDEECGHCRKLKGVMVATEGTTDDYRLQGIRLHTVKGSDDPLRFAISARCCYPHCLEYRGMNSGDCSWVQPYYDLAEGVVKGTGDEPVAPPVAVMPLPHTHVPAARKAINAVRVGELF